MKERGHLMIFLRSSLISMHTPRKLHESINRYVTNLGCMPINRQYEHSDS